MIATRFQGGLLGAVDCIAGYASAVEKNSGAADGVEVLQRDGVTYAEVIRKHATAGTTRFFSPAESSFQFGLLAHPAGYEEPPHVHKTARRVIEDLQQMFVMQRGIVDVDLFLENGALFDTIRLEAGDAVVLVHGGHAIRVVEDFQALSVKQGPFFGDEEDKISLPTVASRS